MAEHVVRPCIVCGEDRREPCPFSKCPNRPSADAPACPHLSEEDQAIVDRDGPGPVLGGDIFDQAPRRRGWC